jgi:hypothetical protein
MNELLDLQTIELDKKPYDDNDATFTDGSSYSLGC